MRESFKENLFRVSTFFDESNAFAAVRQGLVMLIPLIVIGSISLMIKSLPIPAYQKALESFCNGKILEILNYIYSGTFQIFSLALAVTTSVSYAMLNQKSKTDREIVSDCTILAILTLTSLVGHIGIQFDNFSITQLGTINTFTAIFIALISSWLYFKIRDTRLLHINRLETDVDGMYYNAVQSIIPAAIVIIIFAVANQLFQIFFKVDSVQECLEIAVDAFLELFEIKALAGIATLFLTHLLWFFGFHGGNIIDVVVKENFAVIDSAEIYSKSFQDVFTIFGGCGSVLGLVIAILLFSKKRSMKNVAKLALPSVIFNISEVITFGLPIIYNPIFFIPFIIVPFMNYVVSYAAIFFGLVPNIVQKVEWTSPIILSGYQATESVAGSILQIVCLLMDVLIYLPFVRLFEEHSDKQMIKKVNLLVKELQSEEDANNITSLINRDDSLGGVARRMANDLKSAIKSKQLFLLFQPQVNCNDVCIGAEALIRWVHPIVGFVYPPLIIQLAKEMNMLNELEHYLFDEAAKAIADIQKEIDREFKISVNITNVSLMSDDFESTIANCVDKYKISRDKLWLEITEQEALSSSIDIADKIENLKKKGHKFLIDDFGMGHTSLLYLQTNHFEIVKLDGSLTKNIIENKRDADIIKSIIFLGESLNFTTVAEFVENREQRDKLKDLGVDAFQGYFYSKPIRLDEFILWMKQHL